MIKKLLIICFVVLVVVSLGVIILVSQLKKDEKILSVSSYYTYVYTEGKKINVPLYLSTAKHPLYSKDSYQSVYFVNENENKKISVELDSVDSPSYETYKNENYNKLILSIRMPNIDNNYFIENCYLKITLKNDKEYKFLIGSLDLLYYNNVGVEDCIKIKELYGEKLEGNYLSRLGKIVVNIEFLKLTNITNVKIGTNIQNTYATTDNKLTINIKIDDYLLNNAPIIIEYLENDVVLTQVVDNFVYFDDYAILSENTKLINAY
ncbi:MAG: hypothetical protein LBV51_05195 [Acholeplasmatales bacterium]|jgi:hypothetical protein|nr:hypothetical protein [Acholeplasmatales bacterium]